LYRLLTQYFLFFLRNPAACQMENKDVCRAWDLSAMKVANIVTVAEFEWPSGVSQ
jgi:hypothetical protein